MFHECTKCGKHQYDYLKNGLCSTCYSKEWRAKNHEKYLARLRANYSSEKRSEYQRKWYQKQKKSNSESWKKMRERVRKYRATHRDRDRKNRKLWTAKKYTEFISLYKKACIKCGYSRNPKVISLHHVNPKKKLFDVKFGNFLCTNKYPKEIFEKEAKKCVPLCFNCHMELEAGDWELSELQLKNNSIT